MQDKNIFSKNLRAFRKNRNITQSELADILYVTPQTVSKWECGNSEPELSKLYDICHALSVKPNELLGFTPDYGNKKLFIGIDGGGTKTVFVLFDENGTILKSINLDETNPNSSGGIEKTFSTLEAGISAISDNSSAVVSICAGIAGCTSGNNRDKIYNFLTKKFPSQKIVVQSDIMNVINSIDEPSSCVSVICGTGSVVYAYDEKNLNRVGGYGYIFDDTCSGFGIGKDAIYAVLAQNDGFGQKTVLKQLIEEKLGSDPWSRLSDIYKLGKPFVASFSPLVFNAYRMGDEVAKKILSENVHKLCSYINYALRNYKVSRRIIFAGGLLRDKDILFNLFSSRLIDVELIVPNMPQVYGACVSACQDYVKITNKFKEEFTKGLPQQTGEFTNA